MSRRVPGKATGSAASEGLSTGKRRVFSIFVVALPFVILAAVELGLRWTDYGGDLGLVVRTSIAGREFLTLNRDAGRRYFAGSGTAIPEPSDDRFTLVKDRHTVRIFCLGESTMQGFPYEYNATAPAFLKDRLVAMMPEVRFEVINAGLSAVGSVVVEDLARQLLEYQPDLFLVYLGHNEFYGAYGVGSSIGSGSGWLARITVSLLRFRTFLLLRDLYVGIRNAFGSGQAPAGESLMGQMVGRAAIPYNSPVYREARTLYEQNLRSIIRLARARNVPVLFSTLVSNIRDQAPFVPLFDERTLEPARTRWAELMRLGDSLAAGGSTDGAIACYRRAVQTDSMNARGLFALGRALAGEGFAAEGKRALERARDLDGLRFRASGDFQQVLLEVCRSEGVPVARVDSAFEAASPHGIVGKNLMLEHLHPNVEGYFLMAKAWAEALRRENLLFAPGEWTRTGNPDDGELMARSTVSPFDRTTGRIKVDLLVRRWPFETRTGPVTFHPANELEALVYRYIQGRIPWSEARYALGEQYASAGDYAAARNECMAVAKVLPFSYQPLLRAADYYRSEGDDKGAKEAYRKCAAVEDNPFARMKLAIILLEERNPAEAAREIERGLALSPLGKHALSPGALATARYMLGAAYAQLGRFAEARTSLEQALAVDGNLTEAKELLGRLNRLDTPGNPVTKRSGVLP